MKRLALILLLLALPATAHALGWTSLTGTHLHDVCPPDNFSGSGYFFNEKCPSVTSGWNSAAYDWRRKRLYIFGGGHTDYKGNEIYALDVSNLASPVMLRLTDPGLPLETDPPCPVSIAGGTQPNARHTYHGIAFVPGATADDDVIVITGGSLACGLGASAADATQDFWSFKISTLTWQHKSLNHVGFGSDPTNNAFGKLCQPNCYGFSMMFSPAKGVLFIRELYFLDEYVEATATITRVSSRVDANINMTAFFDTTRQLYCEIGAAKFTCFDTSGSAPYSATSHDSASGCGTWIAAAAPGAAYDPVQDKTILWETGNTVGILDMDTFTCTNTSFTGGPTAVGNSSGATCCTFGRFRYAPAPVNRFVVCNSVDENCFTLQMTADATTPAVKIGTGAKIKVGTGAKLKVGQ